MRKIATFAIFALLIIAMAGIAAADSVLEITDIEVEVNGDEQSSPGPSGGTIKVPPGSTVEMEVTVKNLLPNNSSNKIESVEVSAIILGIDEEDDEGDIDEEGDDEFDLNGGKDDSAKMTFKIPLKLDTEETYTMKVSVTGDDQDGVAHTDEVELEVKPDKETHELRFITKELTPTTVKAGQSVQVKTKLINTGKEDEEEATLTIEVPAIAYSYTTTFDIVADVGDDDNEFAYSGYISIPADMAAGTYPVTLRAVYDDGEANVEENLELIVQALPVVVPPVQPPVQEEEEEPVQEEEEEQEPEVQVITQPPATNTYVPPSSNAAVATPRTSYGSAGQSWLDKNKWVALIIVTDLILLIIGIAIIVAVMKRRRL